MKFGEEKEKEEGTGNGFVSVTFEKGKDLLQQQHQRRKTQLTNEVAYKDTNEDNRINYGIDERKKSREGCWKLGCA